MDLIKTHIFSLDRPAQLEVLLRSIEKFDGKKELSVRVQYSYSEQHFLKGYNLLIDKFPEVEFILENRGKRKETINPFFGAQFFNCYYWIYNYRFRYLYSNFRELLLSSLNDKDYEYYMFLTDDSLFYRAINLNRHILGIISENQLDSYSLVLGKNITGDKYKEVDEYLQSEITIGKTYSIWNYPFSVDGRIYNRKSILDKVNSVSFSNPNTFETIMVLYNRHYRIFNKIYANKESSLVGFELNRVQNVYDNNHIDISPEVINSYYIQNYHLLIDFDTNALNTFRPEILKVCMIKRGKSITLYTKPI